MAARLSCALQPRRCATVPSFGHCRTLGLFDGKIRGQAAVAIRAVDTSTAAALASAFSKESGLRDSHAAARLDS